MTKRLLFVLTAVAIVAVAGVVAGGAFRLLRDRDEPWTTRSRAALEELEKGLDDMGRYYWFDAHAHLERALELDPEFVAPQIFLTYVYEKDGERDAALERLRQADLSSLSPQERFLARYRLLLFDRKRDEAKALLEAFLAEHPDNGWALREQCDLAWEAQDWKGAETCFQRLIELYPNRVQAQNRLGYIAMAMGRFGEAEERFRTYLYIAPDQANPHDSLGELLTVVGRYDEAERELREALQIKSDFCASYEHLLRVELMAGRWDALRGVAGEAQASPDCGETMSKNGMVCAAQAWAAYFEGDPQGAWQDIEEGCPQLLEKGRELVVYVVALETGHDEVARTMESKIDEAIAEALDRNGKTPAFLTMSKAHMQGFRAFQAGDYATAAAKLTEADQASQYWNVELSDFKLYNRLLLSYAWRLQGDDARAQEVLRQIAEVNPHFAEARLPQLEKRLANPSP